MTTASLLCVTAHGRPTRQFDQQGSTWSETAREIMESKCSIEFRNYKHGHAPDVTQKVRVTVLVNCILNQMSDFYKANMAASSIVLGSAPMILQSLGSTTAETAVLGLRRPLLSFMLAAGSPAVMTQKGSEFTEMLARFVRGGETRNLGLPGFRWSRVHRGLRPAVSLVEYLLVGLAVTNVAMLGHRLGTRAIVVFTPTTTWLPSLWTLIAVFIHAGGTIALHLRVRVSRPPPAGGVASWVPDEVIPSAFQRPSRLAWRREHVAYYALSWFLSICTVAHVVFGTLIFSSLLFFSVRDATKVVARYAASAIICRAVVRFELAGLTEATTYGDDETPSGSPEALGEEGSVKSDEVKGGRYQGQPVTEPG